MPPRCPTPLWSRPPARTPTSSPGLATGGNLLGRHIVLVAREEAAAHGARHPAGEGRAIQRVHEATRVLGAAEITVTALDAEQSAELVSAACNPDTPTGPEDGSEGDPV
jgi:hypothetical protein